MDAGLLCLLLLLLLLALLNDLPHFLLVLLPENDFPNIFSCIHLPLFLS